MIFISYCNLYVANIYHLWEENLFFIVSKKKNYFIYIYLKKNLNGGGVYIKKKT